MGAIEHRSQVSAEGHHHHSLYTHLTTFFIVIGSLHKILFCHQMVIITAPQPVPPPPPSTGYRSYVHIQLDCLSCLHNAAPHLPSTLQGFFFLPFIFTYLISPFLLPFPFFSLSFQFFSLTFFHLTNPWLPSTGLSLSPSPGGKYPANCPFSCPKTRWVSPGSTYWPAFTA